MSHIVILVDPKQSGGVSCAVAKAPFNITGLHTSHDVNIDDLADVHGADAVLQLGKQLVERIRQNEKIDEVLTHALAHHGTESLPILFRVGDTVAHRLSWEALWADNMFLALNKEWPVGRVPSGGDIKEDARRQFDPPLRVAVVASALKRDGLREWQGIYQRVVEARATGLPIRMTLFAAEDQVFDDANERGDPDLLVQPIPSSPSELLEKVKDLEPHLLHFFCHGATLPGMHVLDIGTVNDWLADENRGSVQLDVEKLGEELGNTNVWAVVLNTCRSAEVAVAEGNGGELEQLGLTHAEQLVAEGIPVAIGMRRLVDQDDASTFSKAFYREAFRAIKTATEGPMTIEWPDTLLKARDALKETVGPDPAITDKWTMPVLYMRSGTFELLPAGGVADQGRRDAVAGFRDALGEAAEAFEPGLVSIEPSE